MQDDTNVSLEKSSNIVQPRQKDYILSKDLTTLSNRDLLDLKSRQQKLLENK